MSTPKLELIKGGYINDSKAILEDAIDMEFETVLVLGYLPNKTLCVKNSYMLDSSTIIGAIEELKYKLLSNKYDD